MKNSTRFHDTAFQATILFGVLILLFTWFSGNSPFGMILGGLDVAIGLIGLLAPAPAHVEE